MCQEIHEVLWNHSEMELLRDKAGVNIEDLVVEHLLEGEVLWRYWF